MTFRYPESSVFYRRLDREYPSAVSASGATIRDSEGKTYIDASGGAMVANVGHGVAEMAAEIAAAATIGYVSSAQFTHPIVEELAAKLAALTPEPLAYSYFLCSGSEAIEASVKLARQYWVERGVESKWKVVSRVPSYHGNTLTALSLSGREHYRKVFAPLLTDFPRIPGPDIYRHPESKASTGEALEEEILRQGPDTVAAFLAETIVASSSGAMVPAPGYYETVRQVCERYDVLFIADEVVCGMGRTGKWFGFEHYDVLPDLVVLGKGLNGGIAPLSAVIATRDIAETIARGSGGFVHGQTYSHTPVICAAGLATIRHLEREHLVERCAAMEGEFFKRLDSLRSFQAVGDVRGIGLLAGVEFVADRNTKEPFARAERFAERFTDAAFEEGLILWPNVAHVDGERGDLVMIAPPFAIELEEIDEIVARFSQALEKVSG